MPRFPVHTRDSTAPASGNGVRAAMSRELRLGVLMLAALLWLTGIVWLGLHFLLPQQSPWGTLPNPWEPLWLHVHGLLAVGGVFLLGWLAAAHLSARWRSERRRSSGLVLAASAALLVMSGYALYYTTGALHEGAAWVHEVLGAAAALAALPHWWRPRSPPS